MDNKENRIVKRPIRLTMLWLSIILIVVVITIVTIASTILIINLAHSRNKRDLVDVINYIDSSVDADDMLECKNTKVKSDKYLETQLFLNKLVDSFLDVKYIYIVDPTSGIMTNVISATSKEEFEAGEEDMAIGETTDAYSDEELARYNSFWDSDDYNYFEETSGYGTFFTACKMLKASNGERVGLICVDLEVSHVHETIFKEVLLVSGGVLASCVVFAVVLLFLLRKVVTGPIEALEHSTNAFSKASHANDNLDNITYESPNIHTGNEIESLSLAIKNMADDLKQKAKESIEAAVREKEYKFSLELARMEANVDVLTGAKNKHAYIDVEAQYNKRIEEEQGLHFGLVICDIDGLKIVNDTNGHVAGDEYIIQACRILEAVFQNSQVYRIGGDEFVIIVEGKDYDNIDELILKIKNCDIRNEVTGEPILACGYADFENDKDMAFLFKRADYEMYLNKKQIKRENYNK